MANVIKHKRGSGSDPVASDLVVGEVAIRTDVGKLFTKMDNGSVAEIAGGGSDIAINTLSSSSGTGGGSATFNGSAFRFTLSAPPSVSAQQLLVSINGVIQKPVAGTGQPSEGFSVDGTDIILGDAPAAGSDFFILTFKSLGVSEPADNSVTSAKIVDGAIVNADINASAAIAGTKISPDFGSQDITGSKLTINSTTPIIEFPESDGNPDYRLLAEGGVFLLQDQTNSANRFTVTTSVMAVKINLAAEAGLDVTGAITGTGDLTIDTNTLHVDSSNNRVGIGTTSPRDKLEIKGANAGYSFRVDAEAQIVKLLSSDNTGATQGGFRFCTDNAATEFERMRIDTAGRLLLGTTTEGVSTADDLTIATSGSTGITIRSGSGSAGNIAFSDGTSGDDEIRGLIQYHHNDNAMKIFTDASERMRIDSNGAVHIKSAGTSYNDFTGSSDAGLVIGSSSNSNSGVMIRTGTSGTGRLNFGDNSGSSADRSRGFVHYTHSNDSMQIGTGSSERMRIDSSGRVLIGTTVEGHSTADDLTVATSGHTGISIRSGTSNNGNIYFSDGTSGNAELAGYIQYSHSSNSMLFGTNESNALLINSSGNVGIGTTSPALLQGDGGRVLHLKGQNNPEIVLERTTSGTEAKASMRITDGEDFRIAVKDGSASTIDALTIKSNNGNVGIGTTSPSSLLELRQSSASHQIVSINRSNSNTAALFLGNNSSNNALISSNNSDLLFGRDNSGTFNERMRMLNGGGLTFNGDSAAANALNDYEEGTFQVSVTNGVSNVTYESNGRNGSYTKIGRFVFFTLRIHMANSNGNNNIILITGLPFTAKSFSHDNNVAGGADPFYQDGFYNANDFSGIVTDGDTRIELVKRSSGAGLTGNDVNRGREFRMTGTYMT